mmetsp:Transcript_7100/g.25965  ORF Transcript_7100/g.25965 Transcript_7100/m.25965 type:complete len:325 (+) Transcript_7100:229-1203(+)
MTVTTADGVHDTSLLVFTDTLLEEVGLTLQGDKLHPVERVGGVVLLGQAQRREQVVGDVLNVVAHHARVHADEGARKGVAHKLLFNFNRFLDDSADGFIARLVVQQAVQHARKVTVQAFVAGDEFIGEGQTRHQATLLEPVDGAERTREEDTLNARERQKALSEGFARFNPLQRPVSLLLHARDGFDGAEQVILLHRILDVLVNQQRVHFRVNVLDGNLEAIERTSLWDLHLLHEANTQVFEDNTVRSGKERQHMRHKVLLVLRQRLPVLHVVRKINFLGSPERSLSLLVHFPNPVVLDRKHGKPVVVFIEQWLGKSLRRHDII